MNTITRPEQHDTLSRLRRDVACEQLHTLQLSGKAFELFELDNVDQLDALYHYCASNGRVIRPIGEGSNLVFPEVQQACWLRVANKGIEPLAETDSSVVLRVAAGENWHDFVVYCAQGGYHGLENLALIPGCVGASPIQNIGAYGVEAGEFIVAVNGFYLPDFAAMECAKKPFRLDNEACCFAYRDSVFKRELRDSVVITSVEFELSKIFKPKQNYPTLTRELENRDANQKLTALELVDAIVSIRSGRLPDPKVQPNAGSFFKNPVVAPDTANQLLAQFPDMPAHLMRADEGGLYKLSAAWLIENAGLKGYRQGVLQMSPKHALVLIHSPTASERASARDVLAFAEHIVQTVRASSGVALEIEPRIFP